MDLHKIWLKKIFFLLSYIGSKANIPDDVVHSYVRYAGKLRNNSGATNKTRWLQGLVVSTYETAPANLATKTEAEVMCEVLYINGWVLWHNSSSFKEGRSSNLRSYAKLSEMLRDHYSTPDTKDWDETAMRQWIRGSMSEMVDLYLNIREPGKTVKAKWDQIEKELKDVYKGLE